MDRTSDATVMIGTTARFIVNVARWASGTAGATVRLAGPNGGALTPVAGIAKMNETAAPLGFGFVPPTGKSGYGLASPAELLTTVAGTKTRTADLFMAYPSGWSDADAAALREFLEAGGGIVFAGQAWYWSYANPINAYGGNKVFAPLNLMTWTAGSSDGDASFTVPAAMPGPLYKYNADAAGDALAKHFAGTAELDGTTLNTGAGCWGRLLSAHAVKVAPVSQWCRLTPGASITHTLYARFCLRCFVHPLTLTPSYGPRHCSAERRRHRPDDARYV